MSNTSNTSNTSIERSPYDDYWKQITWKKYMDSSLDIASFCETLDKKDEQVFNVIDNMFGAILISIGSTFKRLGYDEFFTCYSRMPPVENAPLNYISKIGVAITDIIIGDKDSSAGQDSIDEDELDPCLSIGGNYIRGIRNFVYIPGGLVCFHDINKALFELTDIVLMLSRSCVPNYLFKELNDRINLNSRDCLFNITRTSGKVQKCIINSDTSVKFHKSNTTGEWNWVIYLGFDKIEDFNEVDIELGYDRLVKLKNANYTKHVFLRDFMKVNGIEQMSFERTKYIKCIDNVDTSTTIPIFYKMISDVEVDVPELREHFHYIHHNVKQYFIEKLDEFLDCVKLSMEKEGIILKIV
jgi:hypothetical protein